MKIKLFSPLRDIAGNNIIEVKPEEGMMLLDLLQKLSTKYGDRFRDYLFEPSKNTIKSSIIVILNGRKVMPSQITDIVKDNDVLAILPAASGGLKKL